VLGDGMVGGGKFSLLVESVGGEAESFIFGVFVDCNVGFFFFCFFDDFVEVAYVVEAIDVVV